MRRLKFSLPLLLIALLLQSGAAFAQTASQIESDEVKRIGSKLSCQCGSCQENLNCNMSSGQCHFWKPARTKIYQMQHDGASDADIVASFVKEYGEKIFRQDPSSYFWMIPYLSLLVGGGVVWVVIRKMRGPQSLQPAAAGHPSAGGAPLEPEDPVYAKYRAEIERDTERLE